MAPYLTTTWSEHDASVQKILLLATRHIRIFDSDIVRLGLEKAENAHYVLRFLTASPDNLINIVLRDAEPLRRNSPRLFRLLSDFPNTMHVRCCAPQLCGLTDAFFLADDAHALIRIHQDHARSKTIIDDTVACRPYHLRFQSILDEGGIPVSATTLGL